jgi:hypothetical protein
LLCASFPTPWGAFRFSTSTSHGNRFKNGNQGTPGPRPSILTKSKFSPVLVVLIIIYSPILWNIGRYFFCPICLALIPKWK